MFRRSHCSLALQRFTSLHSLLAYYVHELAHFLMGWLKFMNLFTLLTCLAGINAFFIIPRNTPSFLLTRFNPRGRAAFVRVSKDWTESRRRARQRSANDIPAIIVQRGFQRRQMHSQNWQDSSNQGEEIVDNA